MSVEVSAKSFPVELVVIPMIIIVLMAMALISPRQSPSPDLQQCVSELSDNCRVTCDDETIPDLEVLR